MYGAMLPSPTCLQACTVTTLILFAVTLASSDSGNLLIAYRERILCNRNWVFTFSCFIFHHQTFCWAHLSSFEAVYSMKFSATVVLLKPTKCTHNIHNPTVSQSSFMFHPIAPSSGSLHKVPQNS